MHGNGSDPASDAVARFASLVDFERLPRSKAGWIVRITCVALGAIVVFRTAIGVTAPLLDAKAPTPIPTQEFPGDRFRLSEERRKAIFAELAAAELVERKRAISQNTWAGHAWSREDDRGWWEGHTAREIAVREKISLTQVYLVLDEGIRNRWPDANGQPLPATSPPLNIRSTSW